MAELFINDFDRLPHVVVAVDLTVNGEPVHMESRVPIDLWDEMPPNKRAEIALCTIYQSLAKVADRFVDNVTVTRNEHPGATVGQLAGLDLSRMLDRYGI